jgi:outer membrane protein TolC
VIHAKLNEEQALQGLILRLVESYLSIILQHNYLTLSQETQKTSEERLEQVTAAMSVGYASQLDVYSLQAERDDMIARALFDEQQLQLAKKQLSQLTGLLITDRLPPIKVTPSALVNALGIDAESFRLLHEQNLEVKLKQLERDMAGAELASREAEHYPNVTLGSYYSQSEGTNYFAQKFDDQVVYLEVHVPLYQGGMTESRLREGKGQVQRSGKLSPKPTERFVDIVEYRGNGSGELAEATAKGWRVLGVKNVPSLAHGLDGAQYFAECGIHAARGHRRDVLDMFNDRRSEHGWTP